MFEFLVGDFAIAAGAALAIIGVWRLFPFAAKRIVNDPSRIHRYINRGFLAAGAAAIVWIAVLDNWRQVIGIPTGWLQDDKSQRASDPFYSGDISDPVRAVSWVLFLSAVVGGAYFFARYSRGLVEPILLGPLAIVSFFILNTFRLRFDVDSVRIAYGTIDSPLDIGMTLLWIGVLIVSMALIVLAMYMLAWAPVAFVFAIIYRRFISPRVYEEPPIFRKIHERRVTGIQGG